MSDVNNLNEAIEKFRQSIVDDVQPIIKLANRHYILLHIVAAVYIACALFWDFYIRFGL